MLELYRTVNRPSASTPATVKPTGGWGERIAQVIPDLFPVPFLDIFPDVLSFGFSLALASLNKHTEAASYYKKALELDPDNDTYKTNLKIAEEKMDTSSPVRGDNTKCL